MSARIGLNRSRKVPADETPAFGAIAERFRRAGDLERAVALCQDGLRRFPHNLSARVTLGWALLDLGRYDEAREALESVLKRAPDNLAAIRGLAELHDRAEHTMMLPMDGPGQWPPPVDQDEPDAEPEPVAQEVRHDVQEPAPAGNDFEFPPALAIPIPVSAMSAAAVDEDVAAEAFLEMDANGALADLAVDSFPEPRVAAAAFTPVEPADEPVFVSSSGAPLQVEPVEIALAPVAMPAAEPEAAPVAAMAIETEPVVEIAAMELEAAARDLAAVSASDSAVLAIDEPAAAEDTVTLESASTPAELPDFTVDPEEIAALEALIAQAATEADSTGFRLEPQSIMSLQALPAVEEPVEDQAGARADDGDRELPLIAACEAHESAPGFHLEPQSIMALQALPSLLETTDDLDGFDVEEGDRDFPLIAVSQNFAPEPEPEPEPVRAVAVATPSPLAALERLLRRVKARRLILAAESMT